MSERLSHDVAEILDAGQHDALVRIVRAARELDGRDVETVFEHQHVEKDPLGSGDEYEANARQLRALFNSWKDDELFLLDRQVTLFSTKDLHGEHIYRIRTQEAVGYHEGTQHFLVGTEIVFPTEAWADDSKAYETARIISVGMHTTGIQKEWELVHTLSGYKTTPEFWIDRLAREARNLERFIDPGLFSYFLAEIIRIKDILIQLINSREALSGTKDMDLVSLCEVELEELVTSLLLPQSVHERLLDACTVLLYDHVRTHRNNVAAAMLKPHLLHPAEINILQKILRLSQ